MPFGETFFETHNNTAQMPYLFNAKEKDEATGLYYYGARYYDPKIALWSGVDPLWMKYPTIGGYVYCANNPIKYVDPDGRKISMQYLSLKHQKALQLFLDTKIGFLFAARYMYAGESIIVNGKKYTFETSGDRAKDLLQFSSIELEETRDGMTQTLIKGTRRSTNYITDSDVEKTLKVGVQENIILNEKLEPEKAVAVLSHEAFVHADKDADALTSWENQANSMSLRENRRALEDVSNIAPIHHINLGRGLVSKFRAIMQELTKITGDKYYEQEYDRQVQKYKKNMQSNSEN